MTNGEPMADLVANQHCRSTLLLLPARLLSRIRGMFLGIGL